MTDQNILTDEQGQHPLVSVIMNCYNGEKYLREAIDSVYALTYSNWEIVFWDNASTDMSAEIARSYDKRLKYFRGDETISLGAARNKALEQAKGEFIAFLDCDDIWLPEKLEKQIPLFLADDAVGLVYSDTYFFNEEGLRKRYYARRVPYRGYQFQNLLNDYIISLETAVVRRAAIDALDYLFDERFTMIEEYDFFVRIGLDWKIDFIDEVLAKWRVHGASETWKKQDLFIQERRVMLQKLAHSERFSDVPPEAIALAYYKLQWSEAVMHWRNKDPKASRRIIDSMSDRNVKSKILWLSTFFPYAFVEPIHRFMTGEVAPGGN